jgi:hypothetical protein
VQQQHGEKAAEGTHARSSAKVEGEDVSVPEPPEVARHGQTAQDLGMRHGNDKNEKDAWLLDDNEHDE